MNHTWLNFYLFFFGFNGQGFEGVWFGSGQPHSR
jgi:hypothetical protein